MATYATIVTKPPGATHVAIQVEKTVSINWVKFEGEFEGEFMCLWTEPNGVWWPQFQAQERDFANKPNFFKLED